MGFTFRILAALGGSITFVLLLSLSWRGKPTRMPAGAPDEITYNDPSADKTLWGFFHPAWENRELNRLSPLIEDPLRRTDANFLISNGLRPRVLFWMAIYGVFTSKHRVVHDRLRPDLIYGHIDLTAFNHHLNPTQAALLAEKIEDSIQKKIALWLKEISKGENITASLHDTQAFRSFLVARGFDSPESWKLLSKGIRTQSGQQDHFIKALERSEHLLPQFEKVFAKYGLPRYAARIPFVESSFNRSAKSKIGAMGIWQFTPSTAKEWIGEKAEANWTDPMAQTEAAARMLRKYRANLPDWGSTITAYNSGVTRMMRILQKAEAKTLDQLLEYNPENNGLGFAGENFYSEVLAATLVEAYKTEIFTADMLDGMLALKTADDMLFANSCPVSPDSREIAAATQIPPPPDTSKVIASWATRRWKRLLDVVPTF